MPEKIGLNLPPLVKGVLSPETWNEERRKEVLDFFRHEVYGIVPDESSLSVSFRAAAIQSSPKIMAGRAIRETVEVIIKRRDREFVFPLVVFIPKSAEKNPVPAFLTILFSNTSVSPSRQQIDPCWPAETIVSRGYAAAAVLYNDIAPDYDENFTTGFYRLFPDYVENRPADLMGAVSAWAWCMNRAVDYLRQNPLIRPDEVGVAGLSRLGKTALWAGIQNPKVAITISCCSGCSGAAITRGKLGEHIKDITSSFPYWFCKNYQKYGDNEDVMPVDQHMLLALAAPRLLYISSKAYDSWCDPHAEFEGAKAASPVYGVYGKTGLPAEEMPPPEQPIHTGHIGYHVKTGPHSMDEYDWDKYLDFCDKHFHPAMPFITEG
jgi:hypothetical protein